MIDTATNMVVATIAAGAAGVIIAPDGGYLYVAMTGLNNVAVIAANTNKGVAEIPAGSSPTGVAITPDGQRIYVTNFDSSSISMIATATNKVLATVPASWPFAIGIVPSRGEMGERRSESGGAHAGAFSLVTGVA